MYHLYQQQHQQSCHANASEQHLIRSIREVQYHSQNHTMPRSHTYLGIVLARVIYESRQTTRDLRRFRAPWLRITPGQDARVGGFSPYVPVSNNRAKSIHEYNWNCGKIEQEMPKQAQPDQTLAHLSAAMFLGVWLKLTSPTGCGPKLWAFAHKAKKSAVMLIPAMSGVLVLWGILKHQCMAFFTIIQGAWYACKCIARWSKSSLLNNDSLQISKSAHCLVVKAPRTQWSVP